MHFKIEEVALMHTFPTHATVAESKIKFQTIYALDIRRMWSHKEWRCLNSRKNIIIPDLEQALCNTEKKRNLQ